MRPTRPCTRPNGAPGSFLGVPEPLLAAADWFASLPTVYLSASELVLTFGLGSSTRADSIEVRWPSGAVDHLANIAADQIVTIREGSGAIASHPLAKR